MERTAPIRAPQARMVQAADKYAIVLIVIMSMDAMTEMVKTKWEFSKKCIYM